MLGAILNYLRDHGSSLKVPRTLRRNKLTIDKASEMLGIDVGSMADVGRAWRAVRAERGGGPLGCAAWRTGDPRSLDERFDSEDADEGAAFSDFVGAEEKGFDIALDRLNLATALDTLPQREREKKILQLRFFGELSQRQIAGRIDISQMHVSRLERGALQKLRLVLLRSAAVSDQGP